MTLCRRTATLRATAVSMTWCCSLEPVSSLWKPPQVVEANTLGPADPAAPGPVVVASIGLETAVTPGPVDQDAHGAGVVRTKVDVGQLGHSCRGERPLAQRSRGGACGGSPFTPAGERGVSPSPRAPESAPPRTSRGGRPRA